MVGGGGGGGLASDFEALPGFAEHGNDEPDASTSAHWERAVARGAGCWVIAGDRMSSMKLTRISRDPLVMGGKACIRGMRVTVGMVVGLVASGRGFGEILAAYPYLEEDDIKEALRYAAWRVEETEVDLAKAS